MSYLKKLARETTARFKPLKTHGFSMQNTLRVEETFVERAEARVPAPTPGVPSPSPSTSSSLTGRQQQPARAAAMVPDESTRPAAAMEVWRERPDAIEELVLFDSNETQQNLSRETRPDANEQRVEHEAPDARQAESVLSRVRSLTGRAALERRLAQGYTSPEEAAVADRKTAETAQTNARQPVQANVWPAEKPPAAGLRSHSTGDAHAAQIRESEKDGVHLSIGSIVVHLEPEAPPPVAPQPVRQRPGSTAADAQTMESRWIRSYLDRN